MFNKVVHQHMQGVVWFLVSTHTHTHPFNGLFSRTTQVSRYQKVKTTVSGSGLSWAICKSAPCSRQITTHPVAPPGFCNRGEVRYWSIGGLEYEVPSPVVLSVYQRGSLLDGLAMYLSCDTKNFNDNEITHILHNFWTSTHGGSFPPLAAPLTTPASHHSVFYRLDALPATKPTAS